MKRKNRKTKNPVVNFGKAKIKNLSAQRALPKSTTGKPKVIVMSGYGLNCEEETKFAFEWAGGEADIVHINDLIAKPKMLSRYQILAFPGGFAYGDDTGSGKAYANKFKNHLSKELEKFLARNTLLIGICNGFQIITNLGILPGALTQNSGGKYLDRWVDLEVVGRSPWLTGIKKLSIPIAHGEGKYILGPERKPSVALKYIRGEICKFQNLPKNPNGSLHDIAGVLGYNGRVLGLMPHPERAMFSHQSPLWPQTKASLVRGGQKNKINEEGAGLQIYKNGINFFK